MTDDRSRDVDEFQRLRRIREHSRGLHRDCMTEEALMSVTVDGRELFRLKTVAIVMGRSLRSMVVRAERGTLEGAIMHEGEWLMPVNHRVRAKIETFFRVTTGVYFLACEGYVKIGKARDVVARCAAIAATNPCAVTPLGWIPCASVEAAYVVEHQLHKDLKDSRHRGEWFVLTHELQMVIASLEPWPKDPFAGR